MPLEIRPTIDFAFKKIFGSAGNSAALLSLLNAILDFEAPIETVEILNPFSYQEFESDKQVVLDVRARDGQGRRFNVEMQVDVVQGLKQRLIYYCSSLYVDQLSRGQPYSQLCTTVSICFIASTLFPQTLRAHHRFELMDRASGRRLDRGLEIHTLELSKYNLTAETLAQQALLEQWIFLLTEAQDYEADQLRSLLPTNEGFNYAINTLEVISQKTEDKYMYDAREKAIRDQKWLIEGAREQAREQGLEQGLEQGREEGELIGKVQLLQQLLGLEITSRETLKNESLNWMQQRVTQLQQMLRKRSP